MLKSYSICLMNVYSCTTVRKANNGAETLGSGKPGRWLLPFAHHSAESHSWFCRTLSLHHGIVITLVLGATVVPGTEGGGRPDSRRLSGVFPLGSSSCLPSCRLLPQAALCGAFAFISTSQGK